ncbi:MAG: anti-ECFsigma factor, ChrR [Rhodospirillales bacterium]|nr:anti-ECFsigma factor, ChrR [Rhodospirillales bacterium]
MDNAFDTPELAPTHHPPEAVLIDHASGALSGAEPLIIDIHLDACPHCRRRAQAALAIGGALLDAIAPARLPRILFDRTLQAIDAMEPAAMRASAVSALASFADAWPAQLRNRLSSRPLSAWRRLPAGFRALRSRASPAVYGS